MLGLATSPGDSGLNPLGPLVAALLAGLLTRGWRGLLEPFARLLRFRGGPAPWLVAIALPAFLCLVAVAVGAALGLGLPTSGQLGRWPQVIDGFLFVLLFVAAGEEPGWRGFLLQRLQGRMAPLKAALAVAAIWAVWHAPLLRTEITPGQVGPFVLSLVGGSLATAWACNASRGALLPPMIMHATTNAIGGGFLFTFYSGAAKTELWWIYAVIWGLAGAGIAWATKGRLGYHPEAELGVSRPEAPGF